MAVISPKHHHCLFFVPRHIENFFCLGISFEYFFHENPDRFILTLDFYYSYEIFEIRDQITDVGFFR